MMVHGIPVFVVLIIHVCIYTNLTAVSLRIRAHHGDFTLPMPMKDHMTRSQRGDAVKPNEVAQDKSRLSSIKHRRRLGYFLLLMATCFCIMWGPYTTCELYDMVDKDSVSLEIMQLTQCIGLLHSGISPFLAMASMDKDWSKVLLAEIRQIEVLKKDRHESPTSTNEDALGPFNPKFIKPKLKKSEPNCPSSSVVVY
ncbi:hypothetical protein HUJ04_012577 [Dendroctonus ponderosae]|nr:hypothetical protein HUJ04_012577 [Dendroctonus ponderosae]KAH1029801.1 hypothetical protein HUJ05_002968 [Dendroctonus ponderosae]